MQNSNWGSAPNINKAWLQFRTLELILTFSPPLCQNSCGFPRSVSVTGFCLHNRRNGVKRKDVWWKGEKKDFNEEGRISRCVVRSYTHLLDWIQWNIWHRFTMLIAQNIYIHLKYGDGLLPSKIWLVKITKHLFTSEVYKATELKYIINNDKDLKYNTYFLDIQKRN